MRIYLKEKFDINENDPGILDIIQSTSSVGGGAAVKSEDITKTVLKCSAKTVPGVVKTNEVLAPVENLMFFDDDGDDDDEALGNDCSVMNDYKILSNNYSTITSINNSQQCVDHCYHTNDCQG